MKHPRSRFPLALWVALNLALLSGGAWGWELEIVGSTQFSNQVYQALILLKIRDGAAYTIITNNVGRIQEGQRSGMWAYKKPPTYEMSDATAFYSVTWCAATIAQDSYHSKLYHDYKKSHRDVVPDEVWTGTAVERKCMSHQLGVMNRIGAATNEIDYAKSQASGKYVEGHATWQDYEKRKW